MQRMIQADLWIGWNAFFYPMAHDKYQLLPILPDSMGFSGGTSMHTASRETLYPVRWHMRCGDAGRQDFMEKITSITPFGWECGFISSEKDYGFRNAVTPLATRRKRLALER